MEQIIEIWKQVIGRDDVKFTSHGEWLMAVELEGLESWKLCKYYKFNSLFYNTRDGKEFHMRLGNATPFERNGKDWTIK